MTSLTHVRSRSIATDETNECREADARVAAIVEQHLEGNQTDRSARSAIAGILCSTNILSEVARSAHAVNAMEREELESRLLILMVRKIIEPKGEKHFNFEKMRGRSACGWFRQFARAARASELRNLRNAQRRFGIPVDLMSEGMMGFAAASAPEAVNTPYAANLSVYKTDEEIALEESTDDLIEEFTRQSRYLRGDRVIAIKADLLRRAFNLPNARRLSSPTDRDWVMRRLTKDDSIAYKSASVAFRLKTGDLDASDVTTDKRLIAIWDNHDVDSLEGLLEKPGEVAHTFAVVASMQRPLPNSVVMGRFRRQVSVISELPEWDKVAANLTDAYIATEFAALSSYTEHRLSELEVAELEAKHALDQKKWKPACRAAIKFVGSPAGTSEAAIRRTLDALAVASGAIDTSSTKRKK